MSFAIVTRPSSNSATNGLNEVAALTIDGTKCLEGHRDEGVSCRQLTIFGCLHFSGLLRRGTRRLGRNGQITGSQSVSYGNVPGQALSSFPGNLGESVRALAVCSKQTRGLLNGRNSSLNYSAPNYVV